VTKRQANSLFIPTSISGNSAEPQVAVNQHAYYRQLIQSLLVRSADAVEGLQVLGKQLETIAKQACLSKQMGAVEQACQLMLALPLSAQFESLAQYYQALCTWRRGDTQSARRSLEHLVEKAPPEYRARALQIIGLTYHETGDIDTALPFYVQAGKAAARGDFATLVESQRMTAVVRSINGDHKRALADLENLFSPVRAISRYFPVLYYELLNSLAVELCEVGRLAEAEAALSISLSSSFASAYPEWAETRDEILAKRTSATRSVVAIDRPRELELPRPAVARRTSRAPRVTLRPSVEKRNLLQRASSTNSSEVAISTVALAHFILERLLISTGPRAPPVYS
jgi:tetratricopeptide (TPR) repeat protein